MGMQHEASDEHPTFLGYHSASSGSEAQGFGAKDPEDGFEEMQEGLKAEDGRLQGKLSPLKPVQQVFKADSLPLKAGQQGLQPAAFGFDGTEPWLNAEDVRLVDEEAGTPGIGVGWLILGDICVHL